MSRWRDRMQEDLKLAGFCENTQKTCLRCVAGTDLRTVQVLLGHASNTSTVWCLHVTPAMLARVTSPADCLTGTSTPVEALVARPPAKASQQSATRRRAS